MLTKKQEKIFSSSLEEAEKSNLLFKHGCVATYGGHVIATGYNTHKNYSQHDEFVHNQCSCHAEMNVMRKIYYRYRKMKKIHKLQRVMKRTTLYISRYSNAGTSTNSAPCAKCLEIIQSFHIRKIVFNMNDDYFEYNPRDYTTDHKTFGELTILDRQEDPIKST